jgi:drug/metabolite transporter (DMT)-like permease
MGAALIVVACSLIAGTAVLAKMLGTGPDALSPFQITWGRYSFALIWIVAFYILRRPKISYLNVPLHLVRVTFGVGGVTALFASTTLIPLSDATAISFLNVIIAMALAHFFLQEKIGSVRWFAALCAFCGALLIVRPGMASFQPFAFIALLAAFLLAVEVIALKLLTRAEPMFQILLASNLLGTVFASIGLLFVWQMPTPEQWLMLAALATLMVSAQAMFVPALRAGDASFITPFTYTTLLFATVYDFALFGDVPLFWSVIGASVIISAGIVLAIRGSR